ncbi:MAG: sulfite reductase subunit alpha [Pseudomonadota bacterium]|nr:sulfite reductase subunit alpha [Pseudomonadota bacterium]
MRLGGAGVLLLSYAALCFAKLRRRPAQPVPKGAGWLVVYASQTGSAEFLAGRTAATLNTGGLRAHAIDIASVDGATLAAATRVLFIVSTYGEGDAPDSAARFAQHVMGSTPDLAQLHYAVLALGDSSYTNYCGFGRGLDAWLQARGAQPLFERIDVDKGAPTAIADWQHQLSHVAGTSDAPDWEAPAFGQWRIVARHQLNPGSLGAPLFHIALVPCDGALPHWEAGDLVQVTPPDDVHPRDYSIASIPREGHLGLLVRLHRNDDGSSGAASGWLCNGAGDGDIIDLRVRAHQRFRLNGNAARPLILIGNGSGLAGLRALLKARLAAGVTDNWLIFGERSPDHDALCGDELQHWHASGSLPELDLAYSRDPARPRYVQQVVDERADEIAAWVARGAAIYVCGSLQGMAGGVHAALQTALGAAVLDELDAAGRYCRDVY